MKYLKKMELYDELCRVLTDYEHCDKSDEHPETTEGDLYNMLVKIQNNWDEITS